MVYLPEGVLKLVLSYCDDRIERQQQEHKKRIMPEILGVYLCRESKWVGKYGLIGQPPEKTEEAIQHPMLIPSWINDNITEPAHYRHIRSQEWLGEEANLQEEIQQYHLDNEPDYGAWLRGECVKWWY